MTATNLSGCNTQTLNVANKEQSLNVSTSEVEKLILRAAGKSRQKTGSDRTNAKVNWNSATTFHFIDVNTVKKKFPKLFLKSIMNL